jgi:SAM-dependent methyltransferase
MTTPARDDRPPANATTRFTGRAAVYDKSRPSYPAAAIDAVLDGLGEPTRLVAADVGAGTGISSRLLAARGVRVIAVEPNQAMIDVGRAHESQRIEWRLARAEETGLGDASVDLVLCAQAFHWLDHERALTEFARVLRRGGRAAVVWNVQDERDAFTRAYREVIFRHALEPPSSPSFTGHERAPRFGGPAWTGATLRTFAGAQELDEAGLVGRAASSSYCPKDGEAYEAMARDLRALFARSHTLGVVRLVYETRVHLATRA